MPSLARLISLDRVRGSQGQINTAPCATGGPKMDLINAEEQARIRELIALETRPQGWDGDEPLAITIMVVVYQNGGRAAVPHLGRRATTL
jgi:DNA sulfur modification protein DndC